jgi:leucyl/phenylalanyl-tRNA--protein transferase
MHLTWLDPHNDNQPFPHPDRALTEPDGLLAAGGNLTPRRLLRAYRMGIFPWYSADQPILWWSPDPRLVLLPECLKVSRSLRKTLRKGLFSITADTAFEQVVAACAGPRQGEPGTWITSEMFRAYCRLHRLGHAHSIETWQQGRAGGRAVWGITGPGILWRIHVQLDQRRPPKSRWSRWPPQLQRWEFAVIDCQVTTAHLLSMGAIDIPRSSFLQLLECYCPQPGQPGPWRLDADLLDSLFAGARP